MELALKPGERKKEGDRERGRERGRGGCSLKPGKAVLSPTQPWRKKAELEKREKESTCACVSLLACSAPLALSRKQHEPALETLAVARLQASSTSMLIHSISVQGFRRSPVFPAGITEHDDDSDWDDWLTPVRNVACHEVKAAYLVALCVRPRNPFIAELATCQYTGHTCQCVTQVRPIHPPASLLLKVGL